MKAIKFSSLLFLISCIFISCEKKTQDKQSLHQSTKDYFEVKDGSSYIFTSVADTNVSIEYTSSGYINNQSNPDIVNNEILTYNLNAPSQPPLSIRAETNSTQYNDRIALITTVNNSNLAGPIFYNSSGNFSPVQNSFDSVIMLPTYVINGKTFDDVIRIVLQSNMVYKEIYFAKFIGLIAKKEKDGSFLYVKSHRINK